jgi:hypothetical protein
MGAFAPFADGQVDRPRGARSERDGHYLAALAGDGQGPVTAFGAQGPDIRAGGFEDPQPVQGQQRDQRMLWRWPKAGGDSQPSRGRRSDRRTVKQVFIYRVPVEPGDRALPAGDRRPGPAFGFQVTGEALDVSTAALEQADVALAAPGGVLPQDQRAGLADQARVVGQEPGGCANSNAAASSPATTPS